MGVLAIVFLVAYFIWKCIHDSREGWRSGGYAMKARENGKEYYHDSHGTYRVSDNKKVSLERDPVTGDLMELDLKTFKKVNVTEVERQKALYNTKTNGGLSVVRWTKIWGNSNHLIRHNLNADAYKDVETGRLLIVQKVGNEKYFRDAETLLLVRPTDEYVIGEKWAKDNGYNYYGDQYFNARMNEFNKHQIEEGDNIYAEYDIVKVWHAEESADGVFSEKDRKRISERPALGMEGVLCRFVSNYSEVHVDQKFIRVFWMKDDVLYQRKIISSSDKSWHEQWLKKNGVSGEKLKKEMEWFRWEEVKDNRLWEIIRV